MNTYIIQPANGGASYNISAARYVYDEASGHHLFYDDATDPIGGNLVANLINVSVRLQSAS